MNLNKVLIIGNLTRDPESRTTPQGQQVCSFGVATNRIWKDHNTQERKQTTEYHNIVAWRRLAETCSQYLKKGSKVYIEGRLQTRSWDDPSGVKKYRTEIIADKMIMLDRPGTAAPVVQESTASSSDTDKKTPPAEEEINVEDIPF